MAKADFLDDIADITYPIHQEGTFFLEQEPDTDTTAIDPKIIGYTTLHGSFVPDLQTVIDGCLMKTGYSERRGTELSVIVNIVPKNIAMLILADVVYFVSNNILLRSSPIEMQEQYYQRYCDKIADEGITLKTYIESLSTTAFVSIAQAIVYINSYRKKVGLCYLSRKDSTFYLGEYPIDIEQFIEEFTTATTNIPKFSDIYNPLLGMIHYAVTTLVHFSPFHKNPVLTGLATDESRRIRAYYVAIEEAKTKTSKKKDSDIYLDIVVGDEGKYAINSITRLKTAVQEFGFKSPELLVGKETIPLSSLFSSFGKVISNPMYPNNVKITTKELLAAILDAIMEENAVPIMLTKMFELNHAPYFLDSESFERMRYPNSQIVIIDHSFIVKGEEKKSLYTVLQYIHTQLLSKNHTVFFIFPMHKSAVYSNIGCRGWTKVTPYSDYICAVFTGTMLYNGRNGNVPLCNHDIRKGVLQSCFLEYIYLHEQLQKLIDLKGFSLDQTIAPSQSELIQECNIFELNHDLLKMGYDFDITSEIISTKMTLKSIDEADREMTFSNYDAEEDFGEEFNTSRLDSLWNRTRDDSSDEISSPTETNETPDVVIHSSPSSIRNPISDKEFEDLVTKRIMERSLDSKVLEQEEEIPVLPPIPIQTTTHPSINTTRSLIGADGYEDEEIDVGMGTEVSSSSSSRDIPLEKQEEPDLSDSSITRLTLESEKPVITEDNDHSDSSGDW